MIIKSLVVLILSLCGGLLYRLGGEKGFNTKIRDFGCPVIATLIMFYLGFVMSIWCWILTFGLMFGAMTTYCKIGKQEDVYWYNWLLTGLLYGLTLILYVWQSGHWMGFWIRTGILTVFIPVWSELIDDVWWEEGGRGTAFCLTVPLLLI